MVGNDPLSLEAIHYSLPIPRSAEALTALGLIFDKVYFPGVYLPSAEYDEVEYRRELNRLLSLAPVRDIETSLTVNMFAFMQFRKVLEGFCEFTGSYDDVFGSASGAPAELIKAVEEAIHGPPPPNFIPSYPSGYSKAVPGTKDAIGYPGIYHYHAGAIQESARTGIPLLNDEAGLPIPGLGGGPKGNAKVLAGILALQCSALVLNDMRPLKPAELMEFRADNAAALRRFRRAMLRHAGELSDQLSAETNPAEAEKAAAFYVATKIAPDLDELVELAARASRSFQDRVSDVVSFVADLSTGLLAADPKAAITLALAKNAPGFFAKEAGAALDKKAQNSRSELYYLLSIKKKVGR